MLKVIIILQILSRATVLTLERKKKRKCHSRRLVDSYTALNPKIFLSSRSIIDEAGAVLVSG